MFRIFVIIFEIVALGSCLLASACSPGSAPNSELHSMQHSRTIIVVPGFQGSTLVTDSGDTVWMTISEAIFGSRSLALEAPGIVPDVSVKPSKVLEHVALWGTFGPSFYGPFLRTLKKRCAHSEIVPFAYDWRRGNRYSARLLGELIAEKRRQGVQHIDLVAHSMGGLLTMWYLLHGSHPVDSTQATWNGAAGIGRVVIAGTPFLGAFKILHDLKFGSTQGRNRYILDATALSTFASSYELLPVPPAGETSLIYDVAFWEREALGLLGGLEQSDDKRTFVADNLERAMHFRRDLLFGDISPTQGALPQVLVVVGEGAPTPNLASALSGSFTPGATVPGDGTVVAESARLPQAFRKHLSLTEITSTLPHTELLNETSVLDFLCGS